MNIIEFFAKGGKTTDYDILTGIQNILGVDDNQMNELLQIGINKYGSEDGLISAIKEATKNINEASTEEDLKAAITSVFSTGMFKCGGKMQSLVDRMSKGGKSGCGCKKKIKKGRYGIPNGIQYYNENGVPVELNQQTTRPGRMLYSEEPSAKGMSNLMFNQLNKNIPGGLNLPIEYNVFTHSMLDDPERSVGIQPLRGFERDRFQQLKNQWQPKKQDGGSIDEPAYNVQLSRKQAKQLAKKNKGFNSSQYNTAYWNAKNALRENSDFRGKDLKNAARVMASGLTTQRPQFGPIQTSAPKINTPKVTGPRKYTEGIIETGPLTEVGTPIRKSAPVRKPAVETQPISNAPSVSDSIAANRAKTNAWYQYQYERGLYDQANGNYRPNQGSAAYQH